MDITTRLLTIREVRDRLRVSVATVCRFVAVGRLPSLKLGRREGRAPACVQSHKPERVTYFFS